MPESVLIDCRHTQDFNAGHHAHACSIEASQLFQRMHELPQKSVDIALIGCEESMQLAAIFFKEKNYRVISMQHYDSELIAALQQQQLWQTGPSLKRLWHPSPMINFFCEQLQSEEYSCAAQPTGLDIACGSGRDMVYLAQHGWQMHGIDYQQEALQRSLRMANNNQVHISCYQQDLEPCADEDSSADAIASALKALCQQGLPTQFDLITICRYLHRPLLPLLSALLKPGGFIIYQTFMQGSEKISSPRNPNYLLKPAELANTFDNLNILRDDVLLLQDGRPVSAFIAQKPL